MSRIRHLVSRLLPLAFLFPLALAAQVTVRGTISGAGNAPLVGVRVIADEFGASRDTDNKGSFSITVPPEEAAKGIVRLTFSLKDHQTYSIEVKLPYTNRLQVLLSPLFARSFQPILPPDFTSRLRDYRQDEIQRVHTFLGSQEKKLLILEGLPSVDAADLLLVSLQDVPAGARKPILWWDCEETDSLTLIAEEWARAFRDTNLRSLLKQRQQIQETPGSQDQDRRDLDREIMAWLLSRLEKSPHTIVLTRFDRWLASESQQIEDAALSDFVRRVVSHPQKGKMILVSEEKPVLPRDLNPAWVEGFAVPVILIADAVDFLQHLGLRAAPELIKQAAERLGRHPRALHLLAGSLVDLEAAEQEDRLRQFLQVGENPLPGSELRPLLESAYERLSPTEMQVLDLLAIVRQPLSADEIQDIGANRTEPLMFEEIRRAAERLARERYWFESFQDAQTGEENFRQMEMARPFLEEKVATDWTWKTALHRRAFAWYQRKFPVTDMDPMALPSIEEVAGYDELVHQAFSLAEMAEGEEKQSAVLVGAQILIDSRNWHIMRYSIRLLLSQLKRAQRLLRDQLSQGGRHLYANTLIVLGDLYVSTDRLLEAERHYEEALQLFRAIEDHLGEANTLNFLGDLYVRADRLAEAEKRYEEALHLYRALEARLGEAGTLRSLGDLYVRTGRRAEAEKRYEEALPLFRANEDRLGEANTRWSLGNLYVRADRLAEAEERYEEALHLYRAIEARLGEANALRSLGDLYVRRDRLAEAEKHYEEALSLYRAIEERVGEANTLLALGSLYERTARLAEAEKRYEEALLLFRAIEARLGEANTLKFLGDLYVRADRLAEAEERYEKALPFFRTIGDRLGEANTLMSLAVLHERADRLAEAEKRHEEALPLFREIEARLGEANTLMSLGYLYVRMSRLAEAEQRYEEALRVFQAIEDRLGEANALWGMSGLRAAQNRTEEAEGYLQRARSLYSAIDEKGGQINCSLSLSDLYREKNRPAEALREALTALLLGSAIEGPGLRLARARLTRLKMKIGQELLDSIAKPVIETFPLDGQGILNEALEMIRAAPEEKPDPGAEPRARRGAGRVVEARPREPLRLRLGAAARRGASPGPADGPHLPALSSSTEKLIAAIGLEPRDAHSGRHF